MRTLERARQQLRDALDRGDLAAARRAVRGFPFLRGPEAALLWVELLWADRDHPDRLAIARTLLDAFPDRGELVHPCSEILLDEMGGIVPGDPRDPDGHARRAVEAVDTCLASRPEYGLQARDLLLRTRAAALSRTDAPADEVEAAWGELIDRHPQDGQLWYELALWSKYQGDFREALGAALQARRWLGARPPVLWNIGICATGCDERALALEAWRGLGMDAVLHRDRVIVAGLPTRRVRIVTDDPVYGTPGPREVVEALVTPLGPCDGFIEGVQAVGSGAPVRVLHDGTPLPGSDPPVLPVLALLPS